MLLPNHVSLYQAIFLILSRHVICLGTANHCKIAIGADQVLEIIADNLGKAGWSWAVSQRLIPTGERSLLQTRIATTESVSLCVRMKS
jgi:hypothetical protein